MQLDKCANNIQCVVHGILHNRRIAIPQAVYISSIHLSNRKYLPTIKGCTGKRGSCKESLFIFGQRGCRHNSIGGGGGITPLHCKPAYCRSVTVLHMSGY